MHYGYHQLPTSHPLGAATKLTLFNTVQATGKFNKVRMKDFLHALSIGSFTPLEVLGTAVSLTSKLSQYSTESSMRLGEELSRALLGAYRTLWGEREQAVQLVGKWFTSAVVH